MKKVNLLSKAEMRKVMGGNTPGGGGGGQCDGPWLSGPSNVCYMCCLDFVSDGPDDELENSDYDFCGRTCHF